jgi:hypothetical protein
MNVDAFLFFGLAAAVMALFALPGPMVSHRRSDCAAVHHRPDGCSDCEDRMNRRNVDLLVICIVLLVFG